MKEKSNGFLKKVVHSYTWLFSVVMAIILIFATSIMIKYSDSQRELNHRLLVNQPLKELERILSIMDDTSIRIMSDTDIVNQFIYLQNEESTENEGNYFDTNILKSIDIGSILTNINSSNNPNWRVFIYNDKLDFISSGAITDKKQVEEVLKTGEAKLIIDFFKNGNKAFYLTSPIEDRWSQYFTSQYFSIVRPIKNVYSKSDVVGIVEVQNSIRSISEVVSFDKASKLYVNIYDENEFPVIIENTESDIVAEAISEKYKWRVELLEDKSVRKIAIYKIISIMFIVWILVTITMYYITRPIISNITKPLTQLITNLSQSNPVLPQEIAHIDTEISEIILLEKAFNNVLKERTLSMEYEKTAYFMALQSQINPHFIFNILSVINAAAIEENFEEVMNICVDLSKLLRYSSSYDTKFLTLGEEIIHTQTYLKLMKARYGYLLDYNIDIDEELLQTLVPKLILQPICENSFMHAFSEIEPPYKIDVIISKKQYGYSIKVIDNGKGFSDTRKEEILNKINSNIDIDFSDKKIGGLGLLSTVVRLKLFTKQKILCEIYNENNSSIVEILIFENNKN